MADPSGALELFRVVGIQTDGTRVVLATHLPADKARKIIDALAGAFSNLQIERQPESIPELDQFTPGTP